MVFSASEVAAYMLVSSELRVYIMDDCNHYIRIGGLEIHAYKGCRCRQAPGAVFFASEVVAFRLNHVRLYISSPL